MTRLSKIITVFALVLTLGGHWALLQSVAWVSMCVRFAQQDSWRVALNKTFDGQHPCALCRAVQQGQQAEQEQPQRSLVQEFDLFSSVPEEFVLLESSATPLLPPVAIDLGRAEQPPTPPPRTFLSRCRPAIWGTAAEAALAGVSCELAVRAGGAAPASRPGWHRGFPYYLFSFSPICRAAALG